MIPPSRARGPREYLASLEHFGIKLGLAAVGALCAELQHPERTFPSLLIGGTNGKGSTAAFAESALRAAGRRTARYTSPHLIRLEERFHIGGAPVAPAQLDDAIDEVRAAADRLLQTGALEFHPTFFEVTTVAAFVLFARARVDAAVLEVGLGGRFDATNVITPIAGAITSVDLDHERHLGATVAAIAAEKAGIVKPGVPLVIGPLSPEAERVVRDVCREQKAPLVRAFDGVEWNASHGGSRTVLRLRTPAAEYGTIRLPLAGAHQVDNAVVAVRLVESAAAWNMPPAAVRAGLERTRWPARLDLRKLADGRSVLVDGAHNPAGAAAFASYVRTRYPAGLPIVFGAMADKDLAGLIRALAPVASPLLVTRAPGPRAAGVEALLAAAAACGVAAVAEPDRRQALRRAWSMAPAIAVAGSLYLAGAVLGELAELSGGDRTP